MHYFFTFFHYYEVECYVGGAMIKINIIELCNMDDNDFLCAVIVPKYQEKWIFVRYWNMLS